MIVYLDSSCGVSMMKTEPMTPAVRAFVDDLLDDGHLMVSGQIFDTEMHRVAVRLGIDAAEATEVIRSISIIEHEAIDFERAGRFPMRDLGSLDALHLAVAQRAGASAILTFDTALAAAAASVGLPVLDVNRPRTLH